MQTEATRILRVLDTCRYLVACCRQLSKIYHGNKVSVWLGHGRMATMRAVSDSRVIFCAERERERERCTDGVGISSSYWEIE